jgi:mannose-6-phosphate isomerase
MSGPRRLTTSLRERVWGRTHLAPWFPDSETRIGEAWYQADQDLPLLVKMLFTSQRLSVQVHPDDGEDGARGKTEMWHILEADAGATIALGFREPIKRDRLREATRSGEIEQLLNWVPVRGGETYFVPAHTVHAIGGGIVLFEIQQNSDVTYRLWDYGRPREIHVEQAVPIADLGMHPGVSHPRNLGGGRTELVRSQHFVTEWIEAARFVAEPRRSQLIVWLEGAGSIGGAAARAGEVWLLPDETVVIESAGRCLRTFVPENGA